MLVAELESLTAALENAFKAQDYPKLLVLFNENKSAISQLKPTSDIEYNRVLRNFIELYIDVQKQCEVEKNALNIELGKLNKTKKGLKQYSKATPRV